MFNTEEKLKEIENQFRDMINTLNELRHELRFQHHDVILDDMEERIKDNMRVFKRRFIDAFSKGFIF